MSVHYRFKSALEYDTITFDGLHISVKELKNSIIQQKRIGKNTDFDLNITNAQTQEVYEDENALIPKNTSLLVARVPLSKPKQKQWEGYGGDDTPPINNEDIGSIGKTLDLATLDAPEDDKIKAMMSQSTQEYDPSNYVKIRGANQVGPVPANYRCYKCHQNGHWIKDCPLGQNSENIEIKKSTGIPYSFMVPVEGPQVPGALLLATGQYAVPALDMQAYNQKTPLPAPVQETKPEIPEDLLCSICSDLLTDAVMIPCCGNSFCDECIRSMLLESEDHECPDCHEKEIAPTTLIPNRFLRKSVANFKNTTGYEKKTTKFLIKETVSQPSVESSSNKNVTPPPTADSTNKKNNVDLQRKTVISEADSTEQAKTSAESSKNIELVPEKPSDAEGPPGVSPKHSPGQHVTTKVTTNERSDRDRDYDRSKNQLYTAESPRKSMRRRSHSYEPIPEDKQGSTPTRDEPSGINNNYPVTSNDSYNGTTSITGNVTTMVGSTGILGTATGHNLQQAPLSNTLPPGVYVPSQQPPLASFPPPIHGPPPNFRMPPPGTQPPPQYMGPNYSVAARPIFDPTRPPINVQPSNFTQNFPPRSRQDYGVRRGLPDRPPPGVIDDPLAAFNRIIRELDEKRARQRFSRRSWSRSRSHSRSYSRSPPPLRRRSRTPRRRKSRSRSRSFFLSRSRSRSYTKSPRGSPMPMRRSPPPLQMRRGHSRYRSPLRSPPIRQNVVSICWNLKASCRICIENLHEDTTFCLRIFHADTTFCFKNCRRCKG